MRKILKEELEPIWKSIDRFNDCTANMKRDIGILQADSEWYKWAIRGLIISVVGIVGTIIYQLISTIG